MWTPANAPRWPREARVNPWLTSKNQRSWSHNQKELNNVKDQNEQDTHSLLEYPETTLLTPGYQPSGIPMGPVTLRAIRKERCGVLRNQVSGNYLWQQEIRQEV